MGIGAEEADGKGRGETTTRRFLLRGDGGEKKESGGKAWMPPRLIEIFAVFDRWKSGRRTGGTV